MSLFERIATWLIARSMRTPYSHLKGYMERYWLIPYNPDSNSVQMSGSSSGDQTKWPGQFPILARLLALFGIGIRVHHILRSDDDRAFHDHPWNFISIILKGGYWEHTPNYDESGMFMGDRVRWYGPGSIIRRKATDWHRLVLPAGETAWTLFISFKWRQRWGFLKHPDHKVHFSDYLNGGDETKPAASKKANAEGYEFHTTVDIMDVTKFGEKLIKNYKENQLGLLTGLPVSHFTPVEEPDVMAEILLVPETEMDGVEMVWRYKPEHWAILYESHHNHLVVKPRANRMHYEEYACLDIEQAEMALALDGVNVSLEDKRMLIAWIKHGKSH